LAVGPGRAADAKAAAEAAQSRRRIPVSWVVCRCVGPDAEQRAVRSLRDDLASGRWAERNRELVDLEAAELGARLLIA
jgi:hypothetical protein